MISMRRLPGAGGLPMSSEAMKWAKSQRFAHPGVTHLVQTLAREADKNGVTWKSHATLADLMGGSPHTVRKALWVLANLGVIQRAHRSNGRGGRSSDMIRLALDAAEPFNIPRREIMELFQAARGVTRNQVSNRPKNAFQPSRRADDQVSDQLKVELGTQEEGLEQKVVRGTGPALRVVDGGRAA